MGFLNKILREIISLSVFACSFIDTFNTVKDVHEINHIRTAGMKSNESFDFIPQLLIYNIFQIPHRSESKAGNVTDFAMLPA